MTRAELELLLTNLVEMTRHLHESSDRIREAADLLVALADHLQNMGTRTEAAIKTSLARLHHDDDKENVN
jgi:hypothetical protein